MPLTAIVFAVEALSCYENILAIVIVSILSYFVTELFETISINDSAMEIRIEELNHGKVSKIVKEQVTVKEGSFAVGKQIRDIFWPANLFVLAVRHDTEHKEEMDERGDKTLRVGDTLHVRYETYDPDETKRELYAIVGTQNSPEKSEN